MRAILLGVLLLGSGSCIDFGNSFGKDCTDIGCADQANLTLEPLNGEWAAGVYELRVTVDGTEQHCTFDLPADLPEPRTARSLCEPSFPLYIQPKTECTEHRDRDAVSQSCTPIPDRYSASLTLYGTPSTLLVVLERDGTAILIESMELQYRSERPNGPGCEPLCRQTNADLVF